MSRPAEPAASPVPEVCPKCYARQGGPRGVHWHELTVWCLNCGWGKNRYGNKSSEDA